MAVETSVANSTSRADTKRQNVLAGLKQGLLLTHGFEMRLFTHLADKVTSLAAERDTVDRK